jgi:hypothetical protein
MIEYFILFFISLFLSLNKSYESDLNMNPISSYQNNNKILLWILVGFIFILFIGFRHKVGGDWFAYLNHFNSIKFYSFLDVLKRSDPGYYLINWLISEWGFEIYSVNLICGAIFMTGLIIFARRQPNPWLALAVAVPYLVTVVAMGYTRQAVALGFVFWGLAALDKKNFKQFLFLIVLATTFHKSAVLMIGLGVFLQGNGKAIRIFSVIAIGIGLYNAFLSDYQDDLWKNYVEVQMESQGALIRVAMNFIPAVLFLFYRKEWKKQFNDYPFWLMIALGSIGSVFLVTLASTAVDRIVLYFTPIQVVVFSRLPFLLRHKFNPQLVTFGILVFYLLVLFVWLNYATHSKYWIPYNNILFM